MNSPSTGKLVIISGPSGVGKSTVVRKLLSSCELPLELSVSATTRLPRNNEVDGVHYHFISTEEFFEKRQNHEFLEFAEVFGVGDWYGTLESPVLERLDQGRYVVLEIDVAGALMVLEKHPNADSIFIHPGDLTELEKRLRGRKTETEEQIQRRIAVAAKELEMAHHYQHIVKNEEIQATANQICGLLKQTGE